MNHERTLKSHFRNPLQKQDNMIFNTRFNAYESVLCVLGSSVRLEREFLGQLRIPKLLLAIHLSLSELVVARRFDSAIMFLQHTRLSHAGHNVKHH